MKKTWHALCPIRQYDDKLILHCNSFNKGHTHLVWYNTSDLDNKKELSIITSIITVSGLSQGEYAFYTKNEEEHSVNIYVQFLEENSDETITQIERYIEDKNKYHDNALKLLREYLLINNSVRPTKILSEAYRDLKTQNIDEQRAYFELITIAQHFENYRSMQMNVSNEAPVCVKNNARATIEISPMVSKVVIYKIEDDFKTYYTTIIPQYIEKYDLQLADNNRYMIEAYSNNNLVGVYVHFSGDEITKQWLWNKEHSANNKLIDSKEQLLDIPEIFSCFTEEEQEKLLIEKSKNPFDELVSRPEVIVNKRNINVFINDKELLNAIGSNFYVVAKEPDQLFAGGYERMEKITGETVIFDKTKHLLSSEEDYYFYIQDDRKRIVSKLELISLNNLDYDEYKENVRQLEIYNYEKRLMTLINYRVPDAKEVIKYILNTAKNNANVNTNNIYKYLIEQLNTSKNLMYFNKVVSAVLEDKISHELFVQKFFPGGIKLQKVIDKLIFPPKDNKYVLQIDKFAFNSTNIETEYYESGIGALEVQARGADYFIYQAIDKHSYRRSGYIFISTDKYNPYITNWNIDIEVI